MDIRCAGIGDVVVHYSVYTSEIYATGEEVSCDEDPDFAGAEAGHYVVSSGVGEVGMEDCDAGGAACFGGDVVEEFGVEGYCSGYCLGEDEEGGTERFVGMGGGMEELADSDSFSVFGGGVDEAVGYVWDGGVFEAYYEADDSGGVGEGKLGSSSADGG